MANASVTNSFTAGTTIVASQVNTNFTDILNFLNTTGVHVYQASTIETAALENDAVTAAKIADGVINADLVEVGSRQDGGYRSLRDFGSRDTAVRTTFEPEHLSLVASAKELTVVDSRIYLFPIALFKGDYVSGLFCHNNDAFTVGAGSHGWLALYASDGASSAPLTKLCQITDDPTLGNWDSVNSLWSDAPSTGPYAITTTDRYYIGISVEGGAGAVYGSMWGQNFAGGVAHGRARGYYTDTGGGTATAPATLSNLNDLYDVGLGDGTHFIPFAGAVVSA